MIACKKCGEKMMCECWGGPVTVSTEPCVPAELEDWEAVASNLEEAWTGVCNQELDVITRHVFAARATVTSILSANRCQSSTGGDESISPAPAGDNGIAHGSALACRIADAVMTNGYAEKAVRLQLRGPDENNLGGYNRQAVLGLIDKELDADALARSEPQLFRKIRRVLKSPNAELCGDGSKAGMISRRLDEVHALIAKGRGEWPQSDYVRDETWHRWQGEELALRWVMRQYGGEREE